jgi:GWxTD domain-containing protein
MFSGIDAFRATGESMRLRTFLTTVLVAVSAVSAFALSAEFLEWGRGPAQYLMTKEETAKWKTITTDEDAKAFVALFWARRDPTPDTPRNEFREEYERRVATADKNFATEKKRGALTDRGEIYILFGKPTKMERTGTQREGALPGISGGIAPSRDLPNEQPNSMSTPGKMDDFAAGGSTKNTEGQVWTYDGQISRDLFAQGRTQLRFSDRDGKGAFTLARDTANVGAARQRAIEQTIKQPNLTVAPTFAATEAAPLPDTPAAPPTELTTDSLKTAVAEFKASSKNPYAKQSYATWGEFVTAEGEYFVPVQLYVPKSAGITPEQSLTFFGVVQDESGKNVAAFEEPAKLTDSKSDVFVDRSLLLVPAGKYRGVFGLAENGKPVTMVATDMQLAGSLDKDAAGISPLILSNNVYPLKEAQRANDPYAFGGLKVVPKGDRAFTPADELWYFFELRHPGVSEAPAPAADGSAAPEATPAPAPKVQVKIEVTGTTTDGKPVKMAAPPREIEAVEVKGVPGHFGVGHAIPLASFKPGDYTFNVKVIDTVKKTSYTLSDKFRIVQ